ncbi:MAG: Arm DNA-binding domain-containing protein [Nitrosomonas sp.]|nr:Arm DNA-binding domain-containing protein [Nitrosomonas sp.]
MTGDSGGLYLLIKPNGKYWRMNYRFAGKQKTLAIGVYSAVGLKEARKKRDEAKEHLSNDSDPLLIKAIKKEAIRHAAEK